MLIKEGSWPALAHLAAIIATEGHFSSNHCLLDQLIQGLIKKKKKKILNGSLRKDRVHSLSST